MERRVSWGLGLAIASLGLILSCCLLPYVISSVYSMAAVLSQQSAVPKWLWGDWLNTTLGAGNTLYMFLAEGPICCAGIVGVLIIVIGVVLATGGIEDDEDETQEGEIL